MPQIWPMNWILLFMLFISILLTVICLLYFNINYKIKNESESVLVSTKSINWKW